MSLTTGDGVLLASVVVDHEGTARVARAHTLRATADGDDVAGARDATHKERSVVSHEMVF